MPAGIDGYVLRCHSFWRYGKTGVNRMEVKVTSNETQITLPDRVIALTINDTRCHENYDEYLSLDPYSDYSLAPKYLTHFMVSPARRANRIFERTNTTTRIFGDSGGAQLKFGTKDFIDPVSVIKFMNAHCDIGTALDLPPRPCDSDDKTVAMCAKAQRRNTQAFKSEGVRDGLTMLNGLHGFTLAQSRAWADRVDDPLFGGWACGCDSSVMASNLQNMLVGLERLGKGKHLHVFGLSGLTATPILAWVGKNVPVLTSDSASAIMKAKQHRNFGFLSVQKTLRFDSQEITPKRSILDPNHLWCAPCSCDVCARVKYLAVYGIDTPLVDKLLTWHTILMHLTYASFWANVAESCSTFEQYLAYYKIIKPLKNAKGRNSIERWMFGLTMLKYVDFAMTQGLDSAAKEFRTDLNESLTAHTSAGLQRNSCFVKKDVDSTAATLHFKESMRNDVLPRYLD